MKRYTAKLEGTTPYSQGRHYSDAKLPKESADAYERRTWRSRMHVDSKGYVFIPPMSVKNCLSEAAKFLSLQIPGKGKATYTKHFEAGVFVINPITLPIKAEDVLPEELFVPADGRRGSGKRVIKLFPYIREWGGEVEVIISDETITRDVLYQHFVEAGNLIGLGRFRPRNNGFYGRFAVKSLEPA